MLGTRCLFLFSINIDTLDVYAIKMKITETKTERIVTVGIQFQSSHFNPFIGSRPLPYWDTYWKKGHLCKCCMQLTDLLV